MPKKSLRSRYKQLTLWRKLGFWGAMASIIGLLLVILLQLHSVSPNGERLTNRSHGKSGEWLCDGILCIRIPHSMTGQILADEQYVLEAQLMNLTANTVYLPLVTVRSYNAEAMQHLGLDSELVHTVEDHRGHNVPPNETVKISIPLNEILPQRIELAMVQSITARVSTFSVDVGGEAIPLSRRRLSNGAVYQGLDGLVAMKSAVDFISEQVQDTRLFLAYPVGLEVTIDETSGLKAYAVNMWLVELCSSSKMIFTVAVSSDSIMVLGEDRSRIDCNPIPFPKIGNQGALASANGDGLIHGDCGNLRLIGGRFGDEWTCAWLLPYLDASYEQIAIDALTGNRLRMEVQQVGDSQLDILIVFHSYEG